MTTSARLELNVQCIVTPAKEAIDTWAQAWSDIVTGWQWEVQLNGFSELRVTVAMPVLNSVEDQSEWLEQFLISLDGVLLSGRESTKLIDEMRDHAYTLQQGDSLQLNYEVTIR